MGYYAAPWWSAPGITRRSEAGLILGAHRRIVVPYGRHLYEPWVAPSMAAAPVGALQPRQRGFRFGGVTQVLEDLGVLNQRSVEPPRPQFVFSFVAGPAEA
jgi:hypothetical protein